MIKKSIMLSLIFCLFLFICGCSTKIRSVTNTHWVNDQVYLSYWEGSCKPVFGCDRGKSIVSRCNINADNTLTCVEETAVNDILNPHLK